MKSKEIFKNKYLIFSIFFIIISIVFSLIYLLLDDFFINKSYDTYVKNAGSRISKPDDDVILLLIDEPTMKYGENIFLAVIVIIGLLIPQIPGEMEFILIFILIDVNDHVLYHLGISSDELVRHQSFQLIDFKVCVGIHEREVMD